MNFLFIYTIWWLFWSLLAQTGFTELIKPSFHTLQIVLLLMICMWIGYFFKFFLPRKISSHPFLIGELNDCFIKILFSTTKKILLICFPFTIYFFWKGISLLSEFGPIGYRRAVYSQPGEPSLLFGSSYVEMLYSALISPAILFTLFSSITIFFYSGNKRILFFSFLLGFFDSIMMMSRIYLYVFIVLFLLGGLLKRNSHLTIKKALAVISVVFIILVGISGFRAQDTNSESTIIDTIVKTHTVGFTLFDIELNNPFSELNNNITYGRATFGGVDWYLNLILRRVIPEYQVGLNSTSRDEFIDVSSTADEQLFNAYYTLLYTLYSDFRILGVILFGLVSGILIRKNYDVFIWCNNPVSFFSLIIWSYIYLFSIFSSPLESMKTWGAIIIFLLVFRKARKYAISNI